MVQRQRMHECGGDGVGTVTLYHRTDQLSALAIMDSGRFQSRECPARVYFSDHEHGAATGYGAYVVIVEVPTTIATPDDEFPSGETHYCVPVASIRPGYLREIRQS
jgi:hypothetical protein